MRMCTMCVPSANRIQKRALDLLEIELQFYFHVVSGK